MQQMDQNKPRLIQDVIESVRIRQQQQWMWLCASRGMVVGGFLGCLAGLLRMTVSGSFSVGWLLACLVLGPLSGLVYSFLRRSSLRDAAVAIDRTCGLKDRTETALGLLNLGNPPSALCQLQMADAERHLSHANPQQIVPIDGPRTWPLALTLTAVAVILALVSGPPKNLSAATTVNEVVADQATRAEQGLQELKELQLEQPNPELEQLLKELAEKIEQLKQPGVDPKEALARLSEMEAALQDMQQQLNDPQTQAELQQVGEALALSESMAAAGQAMSRGEMEKAAEELEKLQIPELDRRTEKAVTEKLDQLRQNSGDGAHRKQQLKEALAQISEGLSSGNRNRFRDGMSGLAGECRKQGQRKKLSDLLRKQSQCLSECKSECESECRSQSDSNRKGGTKAGLARSGNTPGDKTPALKTSPQMNITGQDSGQGDVDVEMTAAAGQEQEAVREYRRQADKYEALSESVLESESIPLGHRQTIRRYFEMIRPQGSETDAVNQRTDVAE